MKSTFLATIFLLVTHFIQSQTQNLSKMAKGYLASNFIIYDSNEQVYGYIYFYNQGSFDQDHIQFEYILLDKNLNKVSNNIFTTKKYHNNFVRYITDCTLINNDELLINLKHYDKGVVPFVLFSFRTISISKNTVSPEYYYINDEIQEIPEDLKEYKKILNQNSKIGFNLATINTNGYYIYEYNYDHQIHSDNPIKNYNSANRLVNGLTWNYNYNNLIYYKNNSIKFYNTDNQLVWNYTYNSNATKKNYVRASVNHKTYNNLYLIESKYNKLLPQDYKIVALNQKTGDKKYEYLLENNVSEFNYTINLKELNNELIIVGNYSNFQQDTYFNLEKNLGFYKIVLDSTGREISKKYTVWEDFKDKIKITPNGRFKKNFRLRTIKFFVFSEGRICILTELVNKKQKLTSDFVLFFMDENFNLEKTEIIQKEISSESYDYRFSQYTKNGKEAVFFYENFIKSEKKWILGVNTISDNELKKEVIPTYSKEDKYTIYPMKAKEGYIILREYNENDKYNQIRLEKLN
ncbi:hypothetical protein [Apibacter sp. HY039]|uniref:hypothetical protein n=1 Tax=Apibacter sp. HY039 TaxID=2501476 RepID=UPI000FEBBA6E|nr:hypothetical protein [Apibacter sp. HY039]